MKELITKSLFNEVYNCDISKDTDMLRYYNRIDIYAFAFKCKEWALTNGYFVISGNCETFKETNKYYDSHDNISILYTFASVRKIGILKNEIELRGDSEAELIIKACNWILENSK